MPDVELEELISRQKKAENLPHELERLQVLQSRVHSPTLDEVIRLKAARMNPVVFPEARMYKVPPLHEFTSEKGLAFARVYVARDAVSAKVQTLDLHMTPDQEEGHVGISAGTGTGKTAVAQFLTVSDIQRGAVVTYLEPLAKHHATRMLAMLEPSQIAIVPCTRGPRFNPVAGLPGVPPQAFASMFARAFSTMWTSINTDAALIPLLVQLQREIADGQMRGLQDLVSRVHDSVKNRELRETIAAKVQVLCCPFLGATEPITLEPLFTTSALVLVHGLEWRIRRFFTEFLIGCFILWNEYIKRDPVKNRIVIDEAQHVLSVSGMEPQSVQGLNSVECINGQRRYQLSLTWIAQGLSHIEPSFLRQLATFYVGWMDDDKDKYIVRPWLNATPEMMNWYSTIKRREFLVKIAGLSPFPATIPDLNFSSKEFTPEAIAEWNGTLSRKDIRLARLLGDRSAAVATGIPVAPEASVRPVKDDQRIFMQALIENPCLKTKQFYDLCSEKGYFAQQKTVRLREELEKNGFIKAHSIYDGRHHMVVLEPTDNGLEHYGLKRTFLNWRGADFPHSAIAEQVRGYLVSKGEPVEREKKLGAHSCDLWTPGMAIEIAIGNRADHEANNAIQDLEHVEKLLIVGTDLDHLAAVRAKIPNELQPRVETKLLCHYLPKAKKDA